MLSLFILFRTAVYPVESGHAVQVMAMTSCLIPPTVWLVLSAARNARPPGRIWALMVVLAVVFGGLPIIGADWLGALIVLAVLVLVVARPPWSLLLFALVAATPGPLAVAFGHSDWAAYFTVGCLLNAPPTAVLVWLVAKTRELQAARLVLAEEAILRERLRNDVELRRTLGNALERIAGRAGRTRDVAERDPAAAAQDLTVLVDDSRRTLAEARRLVTRYQTVSLRTELDTAAALLAAAGIQTRVVLPPGDLPHAVPARLRSALRSGMTRLLSHGTVTHCVITVYHRAGRMELDMSGGDGNGVPAPHEAAG